MKKILAFFVSTFLAVNVLTADETPLDVNVMQLKQITPTDVVFTGKVQTFESVLLAFNVPGIIKSVLPLGTIVHSALTDNNGKIVKPGTIVATQYTEQQKYALKAAKLSKEIAIVNLNNAKLNYERQKKLIDKNAVSQVDYDNAVNAYLNAKLDYENTVNDLATAQYNLDCCQITAPFDGIVTEIIRGPNRGVGNGDDILQITRISPVLVKVAFPDTVKSLISKNMVVEVYSNRMTSPVPAWYEANPRDHLNAEFFVGNDRIVVNNMSPEQEKMSKVYEILPATDMAMLPNPKIQTSKIAVPEEAIQKDEKGYFVMKAAGQTALSLKKGISTEFVVEKVYVKPGNVGSLFDLGFQGEVRFCNLDDPGSVKFHDVIIVKSDNTLQNGKKAILVKREFMFMPGELVQVKIPNLCKPGFYVPEKAIIKLGKGRNYIYLNENNTAKLTDVHITGTTNGYYRIESDNIKEGSEVVIFESLSKLRKCYDNKPIKVGKVIDVPKNITEPHAMPLYFPKQPVEEIYHL